MCGGIRLEKEDTLEHVYLPDMDGTAVYKGKEVALGRLKAARGMEKERKSGYNRIGSYDPFNLNLNENHDPDRSCPGKGGTYMNTPTPHIAAKQGEIAPSILLPGDSLRAKFIAENFLAGAKQFNATRNMFGYTGFYRDKPVSVMGTGMGCPSIGIYTHELIEGYGVKDTDPCGNHRGDLRGCPYP